MVNFNTLLASAKNLLNTQGAKALQPICELLKAEVPHYNWVGFYFMHDDTRELHIGPYAGAETDHTIIPYGRGICGQVAVSGETFTVQDVTAESNYLSCSIETKSEIVVPIYQGEKLIGQIDIDSHSIHPFTEEDESFLQDLCLEIAKVLP